MRNGPIIPRYRHTGWWVTFITVAVKTIIHSFSGIRLLASPILLILNVLSLVEGKDIKQRGESERQRPTTSLHNVLHPLQARQDALGTLGSEACLAIFRLLGEPRGSYRLVVISHHTHTQLPRLLHNPQQTQPFNELFHCPHLLRAQLGVS